MDIALYTLKTVAYALTEPVLVVLLLMIVFILYRQNKKTTVMQRMIMGESIDSAFELTISQVVIGIFAGAIGSIMISYLGIIFDEKSSVDLIFLLSIVLMYWSPRFICFSYSAAILGFLSLILAEISRIYNGTIINIVGTSYNLGYLDFLKIDVVAVMCLVAVLHFIEGILVIIDGKRGAIPVFTNRDNKIIGGFAMNRYWSIPIALLIMTQNKSLDYIGQVASTPNWWPLISTSIPLAIIKVATITLIPIYGILGYNSITFTKTKREKVNISGSLIICYSILLFIMAELATKGLFFKILLLIFAPLAHEIMLRGQRYLELKGKPKYISDSDGLMILDVVPKSLAFIMGLKTGDIVIEINGKTILKDDDILESLRGSSIYLSVKIKRGIDEIKELSSNVYNSRERLGILFIPKKIPDNSMVVKYEGTRFHQVLSKIKGRYSESLGDKKPPTKNKENSQDATEKKKESNDNIEDKEESTDFKEKKKETIDTKESKEKGKDYIKKKEESTEVEDRKQDNK